MFDIGFWELTTIAVIALLVIGPDKLPGVARTAGKWVGRARRFVGDVKTDIDRELKQEELRKALAEDAGLDEIKEIMNTDNFRIDAEEITNDYQVKEILQEQEAHNAKIMEQERIRQEEADKEHDRQLDEELAQITDHSDQADYDDEEESDDEATDEETSSKKS